MYFTFNNRIHIYIVFTYAWKQLLSAFLLFIPLLPQLIKDLSFGIRKLHQIHFVFLLIIDGPVRIYFRWYFYEFHNRKKRFTRIINRILFSTVICLLLLCLFPFNLVFIYNYILIFHIRDSYLKFIFLAKIQLLFRNICILGRDIRSCFTYIIIGYMFWEDIFILILFAFIFVFILW